MAQFDVYEIAGELRVLDCQADVLSYLATRVVIPLLPRSEVPQAMAPLHPIFVIADQEYILAAHLPATLAMRELEKWVMNLASERYAIQRAIDMLFTGT